MIWGRNKIIVRMKKRGFTLIEVLIAVAIMGIVMIALSNFFFSNYNALNKVSKEIDLQAEGEKGIKKIVSSAIESKGIVHISKGGQDLMGETSADNIDRIVFSVIDSSGNDIYHIFEVENNKLWQGSSIDSSKVIDKDGNVTSNEIQGEIVAGSISSISIRGDRELKEAKGAALIIDLGDGKVSITLDSEVYFRNKE